MGTKTQISYIEQVEFNVRDSAQKIFRATKTTGAGSLATGQTTFPVESSSRFTANEFVFLIGSNPKYVRIVSIPSSTSIKVDGDHTGFASGTTIQGTASLAYINEAFGLYSKFRPLIKSSNIAGTGIKSYSLFEDWIPEFSAIREIEYPLDSVPPEYYDKSEYRVGKNADGEDYLIFADSLANGKTVRVFYTTLHTWLTAQNNDPQVATVSDGDFYCICNLASYKYCIALAALYGATSNAALNSDVVSFDNKIDPYRRLAKEFLGQAAGWLGVSVAEIETGKISSSPASSNQSIALTQLDGSGLMIRGQSNILKN